MKSHRLLPLGALLLTVGCQNIVGPFGHRDQARVDDPLLTIGEQQRQGRSRLGLPESASKILPPSGNEPPNAPGSPSGPGR